MDKSIIGIVDINSMGIDQAKNDIITIIGIAVIIVIMIWLIRFLYLNFTISGKKFMKNKINNINIELLKNNLNEMIKTSDREVLLFNEQNDNDREQLLNNKLDMMRLIELHKNYDDIDTNQMPFQCTFSLNDDTFELLTVSDSTLKLLNFKDFKHLKKQYQIRKEFDKSTIEFKNKDIIASDILNNKKYDFHIITLTDMFNINSSDINYIKDQIHKNQYKDTITEIINNWKMELRTDVMDAFVRICYNAYINYNENDKTLIIEFTIYRIAPKISPLSSLLYSPIYKDVMSNIIMDLSFPFIIVNKFGIKFLNKCCCDWFNIPYSNIDKIEKDNNIDSIDNLFNKIDLALSNLIKHCISSATCNGFYREYIFNIDDNYIGDKDKFDKVTFNSAPHEIIVIGKPFYTTNNNKEIMITIHDADTLHEYIQKNNNSKSESYSIDRNNNKISEYITDVMEINSNFKNFFQNTNMMAFGRINIDTGDILMCNDLFESLFKYSKDKAIYKNLLNEIINNYKESDNTFEYYIYNLCLKDKDIRMIFTYYKDIIDIVIMDKVPGVKIQYNKCEIIYKNTQFSNSFVHEDLNNDIKQINDNLALYVPSDERNKFKRAISDAIKFNAYNLSCDIHLYDNNHQLNLYQCLKAYGRENTNEFLCIAIYLKTAIQ